MTSGKHVIVELKRYGIKEDVEVFRKQGLKYEVVFDLGHPPSAAERGKEKQDDYVRERFKSINGRYVLYDALIENACQQYEQYLGASDKAKELDDLLSQLG